MELETQCTDYFEDSIKARTAITGESFIKAFP
jgi:hypothetical protein